MKTGNVVRIDGLIHRIVGVSSTSVLAVRMLPDSIAMEFPPPEVQPVADPMVVGLSEINARRAEVGLVPIGPMAPKPMTDTICVTYPLDTEFEPVE